MSLLEVEELRKEFPLRRSLAGEDAVLKAVDGVTFSIAQGETLGLVGESGSGKSTTAYCILQLVEPTAGAVRFLGAELTTMRGEKLRQMRQEMQIVFQDPYSSLDPRFTVGAIVEEPLRVHRRGSRAMRRAQVARLLDLVGLGDDAAERHPHEFSGGQRQRVAIARALALNPKLVICDEPVSALDVSVQAQILNLLKDLQEELGLTYLFIAHDLAIVRLMSDRIAVMQHGTIVEIGPAEQVFTNPQHQYTKALLASTPIPDPRRMAEHKAERRRLRRVIAERTQDVVRESPELLPPEVERVTYPPKL
jgi:ABC-type oligopeptide transport system ATPase subunit